VIAAKVDPAPVATPAPAAANTADASSISSTPSPTGDTTGSTRSARGDTDVATARSQSDLADSIVIAAPVDNLRDVDFNRLKAVLSQLKAGLDTSSRTLAQLRRTAKATPAPVQDRTQFDFAYAQVRACEVALRTSIEAASLAPAETAAELQAKVAENFEAYSRAVTVAKSIAKNFFADNTTAAR
jgi:hypothetical protein